MTTFKRVSRIDCDENANIRVSASDRALRATKLKVQSGCRDHAGIANTAKIFSVGSDNVQWRYRIVPSKPQWSPIRQTGANSDDG